MAGAITPTEIDEAAAHAHDGLRSVVSKLAARKLAGRDDMTPGSVAARTDLIRKLRRLGTGLNGGGKDGWGVRAALHVPWTGGDLAVMPVNALRQVPCQKF